MRVIKQASGPQRAEAMLRERHDEDKFFLTIQTLASEMDPELAQIDRILDDDELFQMIKQDFAQRHSQTTRMGRSSSPVGEPYAGVAGTDRCSAHTWLKHRQYCWSHLLRDFQKILERGGDSYLVGWYSPGRDYLLMRWVRVRDGTLDYFAFLAEFPAIQTQIRYWLTLGVTVSSARTSAMCRLLLAADADRWRFVSVPGLEPTNNSAERALRHSVIWRRSSHGSRFVERILTVVEICRQQQRPTFDFLRDALIAYRTGQSAPSLLSPHQP